jgi:ABC-type uncharacterized transport system YnjBCD ATPase subunit
MALYKFTVDSTRDELYPANTSISGLLFKAVGLPDQLVVGNEATFDLPAGITTTVSVQAVDATGALLGTAATLDQVVPPADITLAVPASIVSVKL